MTQAAAGALRLVCKKCRKFEDFPAENRAVAAIQAQSKGWEFKMEGGEVCPNCIKRRVPSRRNGR